MAPEGNWQWAARGKHPLSSEFLRVGKEDPLVKAFRGWMEEGYKVIASSGDTDILPRSWRFWAKGKRKGFLACGLVRDSRDRVGRRYPLLILGVGRLDGWEKRWDLLPLACERTWSCMEYAASHNPIEFGIFEQEIRRIRQPGADWSTFTEQTVRMREERALHEGPSCTTSRIFENRLRASSEPLPWPGDLFPLDEIPLDEQISFVCLWHACSKLHGNDIPNAVFMGGAFGRKYIASFSRPLETTDFVRLWAS